jgi:hypothetical protein
MMKRSLYCLRDFSNWTRRRKYFLEEALVLKDQASEIRKMIQRLASTARSLDNLLLIVLTVRRTTLRRVVQRKGFQKQSQEISHGNMGRYEWWLWRRGSKSDNDASTSSDVNTDANWEDDDKGIWWTNSLRFYHWC